MKKSRREILTQTSLGLLAAASVGDSQPPGPPPGAPPAFNTGPAVGPEVSPATFAEAEKLVQVTMTGPQRAMAAENWRTAMAPLYERRTGPRKVALEPTLAPWSQWNPRCRASRRPAQDRFVRSKVDPGPFPRMRTDIAFAP